MEEALTILKEKEITHGLIELSSDNILTFRPDVVTFKDYSLEVFKELLEVFLVMTDGTPRLYLCDSPYVTGIVGKTHLAFMNEHFPRFATQAAMITNSPVTKVIISTYNAIFKPKVKFKIFNSEEAAIKWLLKE